MGRFAPSPSGALHFGSLVCALASYFDAKSHKGLWLLRIEDVDSMREQIGATDLIIKSLSYFGLNSDHPVLLQSTRYATYNDYIERWLSNKQAYYCTCTRQQIRTQGNYYPGTCRLKNDLSESYVDAIKAKEVSVRFKVQQGCTEFYDYFQGRVEIDPSLAQEDFIIKRRDQLFAYNLAVTLDDIEQKITHVVRGVDLLDATGRQLNLYNALNKKPPSYLHIPVVLDLYGNKLSKQNHATPLVLTEKMRYNYLYHALIFLGQLPSYYANVCCGHLSYEQLLQWGISNWDRSKVPKNSYVYKF